MIDNSNHVSEILTFIRSRDLKKTLLVTGKNSFRLSGASDLINKIDHTFVEFSDFEENPKIA